MKTAGFILISLCVACLAVSCRTAGETQTAIRMFDAGRTSKYRVRITTGGAELTGILIVKHTGGEWRGSMMNEFGMKAFDLVASEKKCRLYNAAPFLDKWYIRRTIARDFIYLFRDAPRGTAVHRKRLTRTGDGAFVLKTRHIEYTFQVLDL